MDSFKFHHDIKVEKANAILRYRRIQRITTLFRLAELFIFLLIILSRFPTQFAFSLNLSGDNFRRASVTLISPRFVFLVGNAIVIVLFLKSGNNSGEKIPDFYEEYVKQQQRKASVAYNYGYGDGRKMRRSRSHSQNLEKLERRRDLRRSMTERNFCRRNCAAAAGNGCCYAEDEMSSEEFRRTVEAFIARQQRYLREVEDLPAVHGS